MDFFERIRQIKAEYPTGTRIQLDHMDDPNSPVPDGTKGTVSFVDDMRTLHMIWDNGRKLGVLSITRRSSQLSGALRSLWRRLIRLWSSE